VSVKRAKGFGNADERRSNADGRRYSSGRVPGFAMSTNDRTFAFIGVPLSAFIGVSA